MRNNHILAPTWNAIYAILMAVEVPFVTVMILDHPLCTDQHYLVKTVDEHTKNVDKLINKNIHKCVL